MQIGLECFMDEQISSMIASENRHGECEIQGKKECIVCDYVKHLGYDGIRYKSTLVEGGINYAIFDEKKFDCVGVKVVHIGNIHYEWKEL